MQTKALGDETHDPIVNELQPEHCTSGSSSDSGSDTLTDDVAVLKASLAYSKKTDLNLLLNKTNLLVPKNRIRSKCERLQLVTKHLQK